MASPGELVRCFAEVLHLPEATVAQYDRHLAEADLRTKGGRGLSAAKMTARDAAHLLTAILGSPQIRDAAETIERYKQSAFGEFEGWKPLSGLSIPKIAQLPMGHSFIDGVEAVIEAARDGSLLPLATSHFALGNHVTIGAASPETFAYIRIITRQRGGTGSGQYGPRSPSRMKADPSDEEIAAWNAAQPHPLDLSDLREERRVTGRTIGFIAATLNGERAFASHQMRAAKANS